MATWHQQRAETKLYHETKWTVVVDPPNQPMTLTLCDTKEDAEAYAKTQPHSYVLKPRMILCQKCGTPTGPAFGICAECVKKE